MPSLRKKVTRIAKRIAKVVMNPEPSKAEKRAEFEREIAFAVLRDRTAGRDALAAAAQTLGIPPRLYFFIDSSGAIRCYADLATARKQAHDHHGTAAPVYPLTVDIREYVRLNLPYDAVI